MSYSKLVFVWFAAVTALVSTPASAETWTWKARCGTNNYTGTFDITFGLAGQFSGRLRHNSLNNAVQGTVRGGEISFTREIDDHEPNRTQHWAGAWNDGSEITGGTIVDPSYPDCTWSATK